MKNRAISSTDPFRDFSARYVPLIDRFMKGFFERKIKASAYPFMREMYGLLREYCTRQGKRVRPLVLLNACGGYRRGGGDLREIVPLAAVIEMMHSFLLIQDDIIDNSPVRRGGKALHVVAGEKYGMLSHNSGIGGDIALIMADVLFANSVEVIAGSAVKPGPRNEFLKIFSSTYEMTAWGQILDILSSLPRDFGFRKNMALDISTLKTAHYTIHYPMLMGYVLAGGADKKEMKRIGNFALPLGLAFQVRDDILGVFGREEDTGKPSDSDIREGKITLLVHFAVNSLKGEGLEKFLRAFSRVKKTGADVRYIRSTMEMSGALERSLELHRKMVAQSLKGLGALKINRGGREVLEGIAAAIGKIAL